MERLETRCQPPMGVPLGSWVSAFLLSFLICRRCMSGRGREGGFQDVKSTNVSCELSPGYR